MTNHVDLHADTPLISTISVHTDVTVPPGIDDIGHIDTHTDKPETSHQDIHLDIDISHTTTHIDTPPIPAVFVHADTPFTGFDSHGDAPTDTPRVLHGDELNFHIDASDQHIDIPHEDNHGDGLQFTYNGVHGDVHYDAVDHTDGIAHIDLIAILNDRKNYHEDVPRITFHSDSSFRADRFLETESDEEHK
jgi:hypothetical protein